MMDEMGGSRREVNCLKRIFMKHPFPLPDELRAVIDHISDEINIHLFWLDYLTKGYFYC